MIIKIYNIRWNFRLKAWKGQAYNGMLLLAIYSYTENLYDCFGAL